ncbi:MAG TPA: CvpA family protein [Sphingobacteriaceae bacterium]|nr:CvpA family protein [Sphingobacteriaceae bacterium]
MNWFDLILLIVILISVYAGWRNGFIAGMLQLISWIITLILSFLLYKYLAIFLQNYVKSIGLLTFPLAFLLTVFFIRMLIDILFIRLIRNIKMGVHFSRVNAVLGIVPGALAGFIYAALLASAFILLSGFSSFFASSRESKLASLLTSQVDRIEAKLSPAINKSIRQSLNSLTVEPRSGKTIKLNFTVSDAAIRSDLERDMLILLNEERIKEGLKPLKPDPQLVPVARAHSRDMFAKGYFSHINTEKQTPSDRIRQAKVPFLTAGENLALAQTLAMAHTGLMNSPGHRANILHPAFGRVGIGILDGGTYGIMVTQNFRN